MQRWRRGESTLLPPLWPGEPERTRSLRSPNSFVSRLPNVFSRPRQEPVRRLGFESQTPSHMRVEFVGSLLCKERFAPGTPISLLLKNQHSKSN